MRIEIYPFNEKKLLEEATKLSMTPTQFVNFLIDKITIEEISLNFKYEEKSEEKNQDDKQSFRKKVV